MEGRALSECIKILIALYRTSRFISVFTQCFTERILCVIHADDNFTRYSHYVFFQPTSFLSFLCFFSFFLSFLFLSLLVWPLQPTHGRYRGLLLYLIKHTGTHTHKHTHSVGLVWARDQPVAETST